MQGHATLTQSKEYGRTNIHSFRGLFFAFSYKVWLASLTDGWSLALAWKHAPPPHTHTHTYIHTGLQMTVANRKIWMRGMTFIVERSARTACGEGGRQREHTSVNGHFVKTQTHALWPTADSHKPTSEQAPCNKVSPETLFRGTFFKTLLCFRLPFRMLHAGNMLFPRPGLLGFTERV